VRWLAAKCRFTEARTKVAEHLGISLQSVPLPSTLPTTVPRGRLSELYARPRLF
jgi:hypothetical protein